MGWEVRGEIPLSLRCLPLHNKGGRKEVRIFWPSPHHCNPTPRSPFSLPFPFLVLPFSLFPPPPFSTTSELDTLIGPLGTVWTGSFAIAAIGREGNAGACCADGGFFSFLGSLSCLCSDSLLESEVLAGKGRLECLI